MQHKSWRLPLSNSLSAFKKRCALRTIPRLRRPIRGSIRWRRSHRAALAGSSLSAHPLSAATPQTAPAPAQAQNAHADTTAIVMRTMHQVRGTGGHFASAGKPGTCGSPCVHRPPQGRAPRRLRCQSRTTSPARATRTVRTGLRYRCIKPRILPWPASDRIVMLFVPVKVGSLPSGHALSSTYSSILHTS